MRRAGSVCRDLGTSVKHIKINFAITWKNLNPASWDPGIVMLGSRLAGLKIYPGPTLSRHLISLQSKMADQTIDISLSI